MGLTKIEYTDEVSNPLFAKLKNDDNSKAGTFCDKPDAEGTCKNCWAEELNGRFKNNKLKFDKSNRDKIEWIYKDKPMLRLRSLNANKRQSARNSGNPLMVFCCDTFDLFQPSISDELRHRIFDEYDQFTNLTLQIQTTYTPKMANFINARYGRDVPCHYWFGMSAGNQDWFEKNVEYLLSINSTVRYVIFEPLLSEIHLVDPITEGAIDSIDETDENIDSGVSYHELMESADWDYLGHAFDPYTDEELQMRFCKKCGNKGANPMHNNYLPHVVNNYLNWVIVGGESGTNARPCNLNWIRSIVNQCKTAKVPVFVKQLGSVPMMSEKEWREINPIRLLKYQNAGKVPQHFVPLLMSDRKGGNIDFFPEDLQKRQFPKNGDNENE